MAATDARHERIAAAIKNVLLQEYPLMATSWTDGVARSSAVDVIANAAEVKNHDYKGKIGALRLTDLPRELRDHIYQYVVVSDQAIGVALEFGQARASKASWQYVGPSALLQPPLTRTSRQLREETLKLFYKSNKFVASLNTRNKKQGMRIGPVEGESYDVLKKWLRCIGPANIKSIGELLLLKEERHRFMGPQWTRDGLEAVEGVSLPTNTREESISWDQVLRAIGHVHVPIANLP